MPATLLPTHLDLRAAFRQRLLALVMATTGSVSLEVVTGNIYQRSAGSFITDGFGVGDEILASGFGTGSNNGRALITALSATQMTVDRALVVEGSAGGRTILAGPPQGRAWEGRPYQPVKGQPYFSESMRALTSAPSALGKGGTQRHVITANLVLFYPNGQGTLAIERMAGAFMRHFEPGTILVFGSSSATLVKVERAPLLSEPDWLECPVIATLIAYSANLAA